MKNIKDEYKSLLNTFLGVHLAIFYIVLFGASELKLLSEDKFFKGGFLLLLPILSIVLNGLIPNNIKEFLVFWRFKNRLPGYRAFSIYGQKDSRVDLKALENKYPEILKEEFDENKLWYKIYLAYQEYPSVWDAQKNYLFTRDIASLSVYFVVISFVLEIFFKINLESMWLLIFLEYFILMISCRVYASKFVTNVLALESTK